MSAIRISEFDLWQPSYGGATVSIFDANTGLLASVFTNEALTAPSANPQTLDSLEFDGLTYGKFEQPLYVGVPYYLVIDGADTGIIRVPLYDLTGTDASSAVVTPTAYTTAIALKDLFAFNVIAEFYGSFGSSASANDVIMDAAISKAAALGVDVFLPAKTIPTNPISLPANVELVGRGLTATVLQINEANSNAVNVSGDRAGLRDLTLDGVGTQTGSIGVRASNVDFLTLENALIKRFVIGKQTDGIQNHAYSNLNIESCTTGAYDYAGSATSGANVDSYNNNWKGGRIYACVTGLFVQSAQKTVKRMSYEDILFESNSTVALKLDGASFLDFDRCYWTGNIKNLEVKDNDLPTTNVTAQVHFNGGKMSGGSQSFIGACLNIIFRRFEFANADWTINVVDNNILLEDCVEDSATSVSGTGALALVRRRTIEDDNPSSLVVTTGATVTKAWGIKLDPGNRVNIVARVVANARNTIDFAMYNIARNAHRPGSTLAYLNQTVNFTVGDIITGGTSGATARITADADAGATGTLTLRDIVGAFVSAELITGAVGGSAEVNGVLAHQNCALLGLTTSIQVAVENDAAFNCDFNVQADEVIIEVTGAAAKTVEFNVSASTVFG